MAKIGEFRGKCCDAEVYNNNGMLLNRDLFNVLINSEDYKRAMQNRYYIGFLGHPEDPNDMNFKNACIIMTSMEMLDNGEIWGTFDLIDTPVGQVVKTFIDAGVTFGISIRGAGDVDGTGKVDPDTFVFRGFDLVTFPAYDDAVPEFQSIAASSDIQKQSKYKKVCSAIKTNLHKIHSCEALEMIQSQFADGSSEYMQIGNRIDQLNQCPEDEGIALMRQKLDSVMKLYLQQMQENKGLLDELNALKLQLTRQVSESDRTIRSIDRIMSAQSTQLEKALTAAENKYMTVVSANSKLKNQNQQYVSACGELEDRLQKVQQEMQSLRTENRRLNSVSASIRASSDNNMKNSQRKLADTQAELDDTRSELAETQSACDELENRLQQVQKEMQSVKAENRRLSSTSASIKASSDNTIKNSQKQLADTEAELENIRNELAETQSELEEVKSTNLIYQRKIESTTSQLADRDEEIAGLNSKLRETVTANQKLGRDSSNRDEEVRHLTQQITSCQQLIEEYQQAYADMCARAVGVTVEDIPITSATSPNQLRNYIFGSVSSSGVPGMPSFAKPEQLERVDEDYYDGDGDHLVSL